MNEPCIEASIPVCPKCQELQWRLDKSLSLHTQTTCQLASAKADLEEAKREIQRQLANARTDLAEARKEIQQLKTQIQELLKGVSCN